MRIFVTGASGYVGSAVVRAFVQAGHTVTGLYHSDGNGRVVQALGAAPVQGDLAHPSAWISALPEHDVYVHCAFDYEHPAESDRAGIDALLAAARDSIENRQAIYTSGCWVLGDTGEEPVDEDAPLHPAEAVAWRPAHEEQVLGSADETLAAAVVRPGMVYGERRGLVSRFFETATEDGAAVYVGDGSNRWSLVHRDDLGRLYVRIAEHHTGGVFHGVDGRPVRVEAAAAAASRAAGAAGRVRSLPLAEARKEMGLTADAMTLDQALVTARADGVGWTVRNPSFPEAVDAAWEEWNLAG